MTVYGRTVLIDGRPVRIAAPHRRFWARAIDSVIMAVGLWLALTVYALYILSNHFVIWGPSEPVPPVVHTLLWFVLFAILGHEVVLLALFGRTAGKALLGLKVVSLEDGTKPGSCACLPSMGRARCSRGRRWRDLRHRARRHAFRGLWPYICGGRLVVPCATVMFVGP